MTNPGASDGPKQPRDGGDEGTRPFGSLYAAPGPHTGEMVGPYKLIEVIGEGGFGEVWLAERREPMVQRVAIKIIKPGMDSRAVIARFEQERQALAVMDHPNVARVFDGGVTAAGTPYFVMEHVDGEPINAFADAKRLTLRQRL
jgi:serine/threonine protein kinase